MTPFAHVGAPGSACCRVLEKYLAGAANPATFQLLRDELPARDSRS
jgi:hypothetical protein